ncbi:MULTISPECIES: glycerate kinase [unclassified Actinotalea]|uniref:glycerate kinase n=1 Tax=unclassified Actinotalea TaxID=2638618 RepID=UPI0015F4499A|nr:MULTISPECIES: glycerate kinase [unclassified Actinotalea]
MPDKFRGSATAADVAAAVLAGARAAGWTGTALALADGGEGTLEALGGANRVTRVTDPLGRPVDAAWLLRPDGVAVVEAARASGLDLVGGAEGNDPVAATSRGTGELVVAAVDAGAREVVVTLGGSATTDGGSGALEVLALRRPLGGPGAAVPVVVACDVTTRFLDAAAVFGPQKGAGTAQVAVLTRRLARQAQEYLDRWGVDVRDLPGGGAAGGLGGGLAALGARLVPGFDLVARHAGLDAALADADLVVTGEGCLDGGSSQGKVVGGVVDRARRAGVPVLVVAGTVRAGHGLDAPVVPLAERFGQASWTRTAACVEQVIREYLERGHA